MNKDPYIVPDEAPLIILDIKSAVCMANNDKDTNNTSHIYRRDNFVRNGKNSKMHNIDWCEGGLQLEDISTKNNGEHYLTPKMKYIMVRLDNRDITVVQECWFYYQNEIYHHKDWQLRQNTCTRGVKGYRIVFGTRVMH